MISIVANFSEKLPVWLRNSAYAVNLTYETYRQHNWASEASPTLGVQSRFRVIILCMSVCLVLVWRSRPAGAVMIFTGSRNAAASDNSMYCMIPDPFPSTAFGKGSATPD